jgi:hypothetical protein
LGTVSTPLFLERIGCFEGFSQGNPGHSRAHIRKDRQASANHKPTQAIDILVLMVAEQAAFSKSDPANGKDPSGKRQPEQDLGNHWHKQRAAISVAATQAQQLDIDEQSNHYQKSQQTLTQHDNIHRLLDFLSAERNAACARVHELFWHRLCGNMPDKKAEKQCPENWTAPLLTAPHKQETM